MFTLGASSPVGRRRGDPPSVVDRRPRRVAAGQEVELALGPRAMAHSRSDSRLRYRPTCEPSIGRGHRQPLGPPHHRPGQVEGGRGPVGSGDHEVGGHLDPVDEIVDAPLEGSSTISAVTRVVPGLSFDRLDGSVATSAISTYRSRSSAVSSWSNSESGLGLGPGQPHGRLRLVDRAGDLHDRRRPCATRPPNSRPVVPSSPVFV